MRSAPLAAKSTGTCPAACTASVWKGTPNSWATSASARTSCTVPTSLLAHITDTRATRVGVGLDRGADRRGLDDTVGGALEPGDLGALVGDEEVDAVEDGVVLGGADEEAHPGGVERRGAPSRCP